MAYLYKRIDWADRGENLDAENEVDVTLLGGVWGGRPIGCCLLHWFDEILSFSIMLGSDVIFYEYMSFYEGLSYLSYFSFHDCVF